MDREFCAVCSISSSSVLSAEDVVDFVSAGGDDVASVAPSDATKHVDEARRNDAVVVPTLRKWGGADADANDDCVHLGWKLRRD